MSPYRNDHLFEVVTKPRSRSSHGKPASRDECWRKEGFIRWAKKGVLGASLVNQLLKPTGAEELQIQDKNKRERDRLTQRRKSHILSSA